MDITPIKSATGGRENASSINNSANKASNTNVDNRQDTIKNTESDSAKLDNAKTDARAASVAVETHLSQVSKHKLGLTILYQSLDQSVQLKYAEHSSYSESKDHVKGADAKRDGTNNDLLAGFDAKQVDNASLFNFEEVAKNVLNFVSGVVTSAYESGANQAELDDLMSQARKGVNMGVKSAFESLGVDKESDDPLAIGINKAKEAIHFGLDSLDEKIKNGTLGDSNNVLKNGSESELANTRITMESVIDERRIDQVDQGKISIATQEGDKVDISFSSIQAYIAQFEATRLEAEKTSDKGNLYYMEARESEKTAFMRSDEFSLAVEGDLNEAELTAIGDLMFEINNVADEFFNGDVQAAYQQAQKIGFNESEISEFALALERQKTETVSRAQTQVSAYQTQEKTDEKVMPASVAEPINDYVKKLLDMTEQGERASVKNPELESAINAVLANKMALSGTELITAMSRFNHFNGKVLNQAE